MRSASPPSTETERPGSGQPLSLNPAPVTLEMLTDGSWEPARAAGRKHATSLPTPPYLPGPEKPSPHRTLPARSTSAAAPRFRQPRYWDAADRKSRLRGRGARRGQALGGRADTAPARPAPALPPCARLLPVPLGPSAARWETPAGTSCSPLFSELDPRFRLSHQ